MLLPTRKGLLFIRVNNLAITIEEVPRFFNSSRLTLLIKTVTLPNVLHTFSHEITQ